MYKRCSSLGKGAKYGRNVKMGGTFMQKKNSKNLLISLLFVDLRTSCTSLYVCLLH